ncbi:MAG: cytochrome c [Nannocystaceae bacterium]|nr:cytochrome c [Nannocystaceae bacterium]
MKRILLRVGGLIALLAVLSFGAAVGVAWVLGPPTYDEYSAADFEFHKKGDVVAGKRLAELACVRCHYDPTTDSLAGRRLAPEYKSLGKAHAPNLTRDDVRGIGLWTEAELVMLLRSGVHPKHKTRLPPWMPFHPNISDVDLANLLAFLASNDAWVEPQRTPEKRSELSFKSVLRSWVAWKPGAANLSVRERPPESEPVALGAYLANDLFQCHGCHSASLEAVDWVTPHSTDGFYKGGAKMTDLAGNTVVAPGLTPSPKAGIGGWTYEEFRRALVHGVTPVGKIVRWPMPTYPRLTQGELSAMYAYFQTLEPNHKQLKRAAPYKVSPKIIDPGRHHFERLGCPSCHAPDALGPLSLEKVPEKYPDDASLVEYISDPRFADPDAWMRAYGEVVSDDEMSALAEYVRRRVERGPYAPPPKE